MRRVIDPRYFNSLIDANVLDRLGEGHDDAVDEMIELCEEGQINVFLPHSVRAEINHPRTPADVRARARYFLFTEPVQLNADEQALHDEIRTLVQGNANPRRHDNDAFHVVEAYKYGAGYFITRDQRLLRLSADLERRLGTRVVSPTEFIAIYRDFVAADQS